MNGERVLKAYISNTFPPIALLHPPYHRSTHHSVYLPDTFLHSSSAKLPKHHHHAIHHRHHASHTPQRRYTHRSQELKAQPIPYHGRLVNSPEIAERLRTLLTRHSNSDTNIISHASPPVGTCHGIDSGTQAVYLVVGDGAAGSKYWGKVDFCSLLQTMRQSIDTYQVVARATAKRLVGVHLRRRAALRLPTWVVSTSELGCNVGMMMVLSVDTGCVF